jgi:AcrR family transcriptional regulator
MGNQAFEHLSPERQSAIIDCGIAAFAQSGYAEVSTETITKACGIAKGLLFHYFGSKRAYYLRCMRTALDRLMVAPLGPPEGGFYDILFAAMDQKLRLYLTCPNELRFMNLAAWDSAAEIQKDKGEVFSEYQAVTAAASAKTTALALNTLTLREPENPLVREALTLYIGAISNKFLLAYRNRPETFFHEAEAVKAQIKAHIDLMLYGIMKE